MANANMLEMVNIELCMVDDMIKQLEHIYNKYMSIHKSLELSGVSKINQRTLEDILITNDEIKRKLTQLLASRDGTQEKIIEELKALKEDK